MYFNASCADCRTVWCGFGSCWPSPVVSSLVIFCHNKSTSCYCKHLNQHCPYNQNIIEQKYHRTKNISSNGFISSYTQTQVMWLVVTNVRSKSFGLVTECQRYNTHHILSSSVVSHAFSALRKVCIYSKIGHHPHLPGYLCAKFCFFHGPHCWTSLWRKIAYSITHFPSENTKSI